MQARRFFYDTTGCADVVIFDGETYRYNGDNYPSLAAVLDGLDWGEGPPPFTEVSGGDVDGLLRLLQLLEDYAAPVMEQLQDFETMLSGEHGGAVPALVNFLRRGPHSGRTELRWERRYYRFELACTISHRLQAFAHFKRDLSGIQWDRNSTEDSTVFQSKANPLDLAVRSSDGFWRGATLELHLYEKEYNGLSEAGGDLVSGLLDWLAEDWLSCARECRAAERLLQHLPHLGGVESELEGAPKVLVEAFQRMTTLQLGELQELQEFFEFMREVRAANARYRRARRRARRGA